MIDPRESVIARRLKGIARIVGLASAKGGVGKTLCASLSAVLLARAGKRVGLLDLDLQGASAHIILGVRPRMPEEERGILPIPVVEGLSFMSAAMFAGESAMALRGHEVSDAIRELLAVTQWGTLDFLLIDMPPGIGDELLDCARLIPRLEALVISTPSAVSVAVVQRLLAVLAEVHVPIPGILANMAHGRAEGVRNMARAAGVPFAGEVQLDGAVEASIGHPLKLAGTRAAADLGRALEVMHLLEDGTAPPGNI
jgi:ATP-binding protein involved in chromosome partitioning